MSLIEDAELHAYIDGLLPPDRVAYIETALRGDPDLAGRVGAYAGDRAALRAAFPLPALDDTPPAWIARIRAAQAAPPVALPPARRARPAVPRARGTAQGWAMALAACLLLALGLGIYLRPERGGADAVLLQAEQARLQRLAPTLRLDGAQLADAARLSAAMTGAVGLKIAAPDLSRLGWRLREADTYPHAAALRYAAADGRALTLFVRKSSGEPRFDLLKTGAIRTCIWQDEVVGAVMMGDMSAGQMMRVASAAYVALNL
jgi:anti-sigma factor RsiW